MVVDAPPKDGSTGRSSSSTSADGNMPSSHVRRLPPPASKSFASIFESTTNLIELTSWTLEHSRRHAKTHTPGSRRHAEIKADIAELEEMIVDARLRLDRAVAANERKRAGERVGTDALNVPNTTTTSGATTLNEAQDVPTGKADVSRPSAQADAGRAVQQAPFSRAAAEDDDLVTNVPVAREATEPPATTADPPTSSGRGSQTDPPAPRHDSRGSSESILAKNEMKNEPDESTRATAVASPRQTPSSSCAPSLATPADKNINSSKSGQGKGASAKAPPRQSSEQSGGRSKIGPVTILPRHGNETETTAGEPRRPESRMACAPPIKPPAQDFPAKGNKKEATKGDETRGRTDTRQRGRGVPATSQQSASTPSARPVLDTTADPQRRTLSSPPSRKLWSAKSPHKTNQQGRGVLANAPQGDSRSEVDDLRREIERLMAKAQRDKLEREALKWNNAKLRRHNAALRQQIASHETKSTESDTPVRGLVDEDDDATVSASNLTPAEAPPAIVLPADAPLPAESESTASDWSVPGASSDSPSGVDPVADICTARSGRDERGSPADEDEEAPSIIHRRGSSNNLYAVLTAPLSTFKWERASTDDNRQVETNNQHESQDLEGLPPEPKKKRRRIRKRNRKRRRRGHDKKSRPRHSPVTPPRHHAKARQQAAREFQAVSTVFHSKAAGCCPVSGFDSIWDRTATKRIGLLTSCVANQGILLGPTKACKDQNLRELVTSKMYP